MKHPLWGPKADHWVWWQHVVAWAIYIPLLMLLVKGAAWLTRLVFPPS